jgi:hypothetical protein
LKICRNCGTELSDQAIFCHECGASDATGVESRPPTVSRQPLTLSKEVFYVVIIALALMGILVVGLAVRGPGGSVTQTQTNYVTNYVTQMQFTTFSAGFTSSTTTTQAYTVTVASFSTLAAGPPPTWFSQQYCGYPFNPYVCNEGPPVTVTGYLTSDSSCVDLYVATGVTYVVWNLNKTLSDSAYQIYGFVYPNWPPSQPFPPYPFQKTLCVGIPMWSIPPYYQPA